MGSITSVTTAVAAMMLFVPQSVAREFNGTISPDPLPAYPMYAVDLKAPDPSAAPALPELPAGASIFQGRLDRSPDSVEVVLVESSAAPYTLYADKNRNGVFEITERISLAPEEDRPEFAPATVVILESRCRIPNLIPVGIRLAKTQPLDRSIRTILRSSGLRVEVECRLMAASGWSPIRTIAMTGQSAPRNGRVGIDTDGDGSINWGAFSVEMAYAEDEDPVFRVGKNYVSTKSIDLRNRRVVLQSHPESDYRWIELGLGKQVPDLTFTGFDGKQSRLSQVRARYILLDFWFSSCGPCIAAIPELCEMRAKYRSRGFEILGLNIDEFPEGRDKGRRLLADYEADWPQAAGLSVRDLVKRRFRIPGFPTYLLLDGNRRVVSLGQPGQMPIRGKELEATLEQLVGQSSGGR